MENRGVTGDQALDTERVAVTGNNVSFRTITRKEVASLGQRTLKALPRGQTRDGEGLPGSGLGGQNGSRSFCQGRGADKQQNSKPYPTLAINYPMTLNTDQAEKEFSRVKKHPHKHQPNDNFRSHLPFSLGKGCISVRVRFLTWMTSPVLKDRSSQVRGPGTLINCSFELQNY